MMDLTCVCIYILQVLLSGGSAGGLGSIIHCDRFRALFSKNVRVKCHADGALFIRV